MNDVFRTSDLALATYLKLSGLELAETEPASDNKDKIVFTFKQKDRAIQLKDAYFSHGATVDPLNFINTFRNMKAMVSRT